MTISTPATDSVTQRAAGLPEPTLAAQAIALVLQPLARLMIDHGLQLASLVELLKQALVQEAVAAYGLADKGSSDTRIALLTGVVSLTAVMEPPMFGVMEPQTGV